VPSKNSKATQPFAGVSFIFLAMAGFRIWIEEARTGLLRPCRATRQQHRVGPRFGEENMSPPYRFYHKIGVGPDFETLPVASDALTLSQ
jgi:hypothetical protein